MSIVVSETSVMMQEHSSETGGVCYQDVIGSAEQVQGSAGIILL